jgi:tetratricopeptide (TPR) repeat protein
MPGGRRRTLRRDVVILAGAAGTYEIAPIEAVVEGVTYRTGPLVLVVSPALGGGLRAPEFAGPDAEVIFRAGISPDTVYVGQQATLRAEAQFEADLRHRLRRAPEYLPPVPSGFWLLELPTPPFERRIEGGRLYEVQGFRRAYFALTPGRHMLPPARLQYEVRRGFLYPSEAIELSSDSLALVVLPLPEADRPESFTGAVGRFRVRAHVQPQTLAAGEAATLRVEVEGIGNVKALPPPNLPVLQDVDVLPPTEQSSFRSGTSWIGGTKTFTWIIVPQREGRLELPIEYGYFDPLVREYAVAGTAPLVLEVGPGSDATAVVDPARIRPLRGHPGGGRRMAWIRSPAFAALQALPVALLAGVLLVRRQRAPVRPGARALRRRRDAVLERLLAPAGVSSAAFFRDLAGAVREWLALYLEDDRLARAGPGEVGRILAKRGVPEAVAAELGETLLRLERAPYEPTLPGEAERRVLVGRSARLLSAVELAVRPRAARSWPLPLLLLLLWPVRPASADPAIPAEPDAPFEAGVAAFAAGDYQSAMTAFERHVALQPLAAGAWYNLGNASFMAGHRGGAVWAWARALRLDPRDGAARHNLAVAGVSDRLVASVTPWLPVTTDELLLLLSLCWLIGGSLGVAAAFLPRRRRMLLPPALVAGLATLVLLASLGSTLRAPPAIVTAATANLVAAPARGAEVIRPLEPCAAVRVVARRQDWLRVRAFTGVEGWIRRGDLGEL